MVLVGQTEVEASTNNDVVVSFKIAGKPIVLSKKILRIIAVGLGSVLIIFALYIGLGKKSSVTKVSQEDSSTTETVIQTDSDIPNKKSDILDNFEMRPEPRPNFATTLSKVGEDSKTNKTKGSETKKNSNTLKPIKGCANPKGVNKSSSSPAVEPYLVVPSNFKQLTKDANIEQWYRTFLDNEMKDFYQEQACGYMTVLPLQVIYSDKPSGWFWCQENPWLNSGCEVRNFEHNTRGILPSKKNPNNVVLVAQMGGGGYAGAREGFAMVGNIALAAGDGCKSYNTPLFKGDLAPDLCKNDWIKRGPNGTGGAKGAILHELGHGFGLEGHDAKRVNRSVMSGHYNYPNVKLTFAERKELKSGSFFK